MIEFGWIRATSSRSQPSRVADGYFVRVQWITRQFMEGKVSTHREEDLYKLAYQVTPSPDRDQGRNDEARPRSAEP